MARPLDDWFLPWEAREVVVDQRPHGCAADVWSLGTLMWEMFSDAATPYTGEPASHVRHKVLLHHIDV